VEVIERGRWHADQGGGPRSNADHRTGKHYLHVETRLKRLSVRHADKMAALCPLASRHEVSLRIERDGARRHGWLPPGGAP
jgi:hypothetical protein